MKRSRGIAVSGVFSALAVVLMWLGALSGLGTYASPLMAGVALIPVGLLLGKRTQSLSFAAVSLLCLLLSADWEENLLFIGLFGWYPILRPGLEKNKKSAATGRETADFQRHEREHGAAGHACARAAERKNMDTDPAARNGQHYLFAL